MSLFLVVALPFLGALLPGLMYAAGRSATAGVTFTVTWRVTGVERQGNQLKAVVGSDYGAMAQERVVDQVVVNHGTLPLDDLYFALKPLSVNLGALDHEELVAQSPQSVVRNPEGKFRLWRIGDAVASRNTHAAILDALRLMAVH